MASSSLIWGRMRHQAGSRLSNRLTVQARSKMFLIDVAYQRPPRAVETPSAFRTSAMSRNVVAPGTLSLPRSHGLDRKPACRERE